MTSANDPDRLQKVYMTINTGTDGPDPGLNNLLELSCILHYESGEIIEEFNIKLKPQNNRKPDESTLKNFWDKNIEAKEWVQKDCVDVEYGISKFVEFYEKYNTKYSIRFVGDPASRDFVWLQEYYTNYAVFSTTKLYPYCRCLTTMRKSYQKMTGLTDEESWALKREMQRDMNNINNINNTNEDSHIGIVRARKQAREFCLLRNKMYNYNTFIRDNKIFELQHIINDKLLQNEKVFQLTTNEIKELVKTNINITKNTNNNKTKQNIIKILPHYFTGVDNRINALKTNIVRELSNEINKLKEIMIYKIEKNNKLEDIINNKYKIEKINKQNKNKLIKNNTQISLSTIKNNINKKKLQLITSISICVISTILYLKL